MQSTIQTTYDTFSENLYTYTKEVLEPLQILWLIITLLLAVKYLLKK